MGNYYFKPIRATVAQSAEQRFRKPQVGGSSPPGGSQKELKMKNLFIAYSLIWIGIFLYLLKIHSKVAKLEKELKELEEKQNENI